jgi:hypothetical protein
MFEQTFKNIDDVLWKESGCTTELDYTEQTSWLLFLKYLDDLERDRADKAELTGERYGYIDDEPYMAIMRKYGPRLEGRDHPADHFANALGAFLLACRTESALNGTFPDYLGRIYEEEALTNKYTGQFFTPEPLCQMMAQMTVEPTQEPITIADPACGSGRFFIAAMPLAPNATFYGTDRDHTCVKMTALNMLMRNADAYIVHGNTLSMETWGGYTTRGTFLGGSIQELGAGTANAILTNVSKAIAEKQATVVTKPPEPPRPKPEPDAGTVTITENKKGQFGFDF